MKNDRAKVPAATVRQGHLRAADDNRSVCQEDRIRRSTRTPVFDMSEEGNSLPSGKTAEQDRLDLYETTASASTHFIQHVVTQIGCLGRDEINAGLAFLRGLEPRDELETLLISQMFAAHVLSMRFGGRAIKTDDADLADRNVNRFRKLTSLYSAHLEALNKHRGKGQQKVTVEHVTVNEGGQAIVGSTIEGGGGHGRSKR